MTQEEKAKRYDEAYKVAESIHRFSSNIAEIKRMEEIFPELAENEDERIIKNIISWLKNIDGQTIPINDYNSALAWLEKQGGQKPFDYENVNIQQNDFAPKSAMEAIKEEKVDNANKVEPKFKVGDWTVSNLDKEARQISEVHFDEYNSYYVVNGKCVNLEEYDRLHYLWTISDAKDGDVLTASDGSIFLFAGVVDCACKHYVALTTDGVIKFNKGLEHYWETSRAVYPATKEQRDLLFKAMEGAGYTFDFDKKESKKIEQNPAWSEEDERNLQGIWDEILANKHDAKECEWKTYDKFLDWLKSLEDRVQPQSKQEWGEEDEEAIDMAIIALDDMYDPDEPNTTYSGYSMSFSKAAEILKSLKERVQPQQEWSEEDEDKIVLIEKAIYSLVNDGITFTDATRLCDWIKSLKPHNIWKPNDEQMAALNAITVTGCISYTGQGQDLAILYNDLKKL